MSDDRATTPAARRARLRRLAEELAETGVALEAHVDVDLLLEEVDRALRPIVHERRVPSGGTFLDPRADPDTWPAISELTIAREPVGGYPLDAARRFADGLSSWLLRRSDGPSEWVLFDRPAGSERDLVVLAEALDATVVQRHPSGSVRIAGAFGVLRWEGFGWHHVPPVASWLDLMAACTVPYDVAALGALLQFAVHDLGAQGIGALLIYREQIHREEIQREEIQREEIQRAAGERVPRRQQRAAEEQAAEQAATRVQERLEVPPPLRIDEPTHLGPLRHALAQIDGGAVFDRHGTLRRLGVRLVPSATAEAEVEGFKGMRHTSGRRYSFDDPHAIVIAVSEDGPVSVFRNGAVLGRSRFS